MYKYDYRIYYTGPERYAPDGLAQILAMKAEAERWGFTFVNDLTGSEPDSGTVFEAGMCYGLGYPCYYFMSDSRPLIERVNYS